MRVRPFFWVLLLTSCLSVIILALLYNPQAPTHLQVHVDKLVSHGLSNFYLQLTDPEGVPITQAHVQSDAHMTNMDMMTDRTYVKDTGNGRYLVQIHLYMAGPWVITVQAQADGFLAQQQTVFVKVI